MLNNDLIILVSHYINLDEYKSLSCLNKYINNSLIKNVPDYIKLEYIITKLKEYPIELLNYLNPIKIYKLPFIKIKKFFYGDYIDFLDKTYFKTTNVIRGIDKFNRPFISLLYNKEESLVTTLFQRYSDNKFRWVTGGPNHFGGATIVFDTDYIDKNEKAILLLNQIKSFL